MSDVSRSGITKDAPPNEREAIRDLIRTKLHADRLPRDCTPRAFGRPGNWQNCAVCEETLAKALLMMEVYPDDERQGRSLSRRLLQTLERGAARAEVVAPTALTPVY
jgi:hypothetical protein